MRADSAALESTGNLLIPGNADPSGALAVDAGSLLYPHPASGDAPAWAAWQRELREALVRDVYRLDFSAPPSPAAALELKREAIDGELVRREYLLTAADGDRLPLVVLLPSSSAGRLPAVVFVHGHVKDGESGLAQAVLPLDSYHQSGARRLAEAGFVTAAFELRGFGMRGPPRFPDHRVVAYNALLAGSFYKQLAFDEVRRIVDALRAIPQVDPGRIGIAGASLGGEIAVEYAALDERIRAVSFHSHGGRVGPYTGIREPGASQPHYCHFVPGLPRLMHRQDPFLLLAPRPVHGIRGQRQPFAEAEFSTELIAAWQRFGRQEQLKLEVGQAPAQFKGHAFFPAEAVEFFRTFL